MVDCIIIGAGMAGLTAARILYDAGYDVLVLEKSRGIGGRMATRRFAGGVFDTGAQFISARSEGFQKIIDDCLSNGSAKVWADGFPKDNMPPQNSHARYCGSVGMTAIAKDLAKDIDIEYETRVKKINPPNGNEVWKVEDEEGNVFKASSLLMTPPAPQLLELLLPIQDSLLSDGIKELEQVQYHCCICVVAALKDKTKVPAPGGIHLSDHDLVWVADNQQKGISDVPSLTLHGAPEFSRLNYDQSDEELISKMIELAKPIIGDCDVVEAQVRRWRYSLPFKFTDNPFVKLLDRPAMLAAGEAMVGGKVEGAYTSGKAAADWLLEYL